MKKVIELAAEMSENFETKTRDDGKEFVCLKDGAPDWMKDNVIFPVHGDKGPDDTVYRFVQMAVDTISECDDDMTKDDIQDRLFEIETDIYTSDLTAWLNARTDHIYYLTQALDEFGITDGFQALGVAQKIQIDEITGAVFQALMSIAEN